MTPRDVDNDMAFGESVITFVIILGILRGQESRYACFYGVK
jgi:hypothetical protein